MRAKEIFEQAREAAINICDIYIKAELMRERIGIRSRASDSVYVQALDPMRKVDDLIDWEIEEFRTIVASSHDALADAELLIAGVEALGFTEAAKTLRLYYVEAWETDEVSRSLGYPPEAVSMMLETATSWIDETGIAKVKEAGR